MSAYGERQLDKVIEAYAKADHRLPARYPPLPAWQDLTISMREAFIAVYCTGRSAALDEERGVAPDKPMRPLMGNFTGEGLNKIFERAERREKKR